MSGEQQLRQLVERILRLKEEQDSIAADIREIYAEAKGSGFDKTAMGQLVSHLRKVEKVGVAAVEEGQSTFDLYLSAYERATGTPIATHTHEASQSYAEAKGRGFVTSLTEEQKAEALAYRGDDTHGELTDTVKALREVTRQNGTNFDGYDAETRTFPAERELTDTQEQPETDLGSSDPQSEQPSFPPVASESAGTSSDENPAPISNPQPAASLGADKAGDVSPPSSPASSFNNPRCKHPSTCSHAHDQGSCDNCFFDWAKRPLEEQRRLWAEAMEAASETEAA